MLFPFPLVTQNYSHSNGNPMGMEIPIPMHIFTRYEVFRRQLKQMPRKNTANVPQ